MSSLIIPNLHVHRSTIPIIPNGHKLKARSPSGTEPIVGVRVKYAHSIALDMI